MGNTEAFVKCPTFGVKHGKLVQGNLCRIPIDQATVVVRQCCLIVHVGLPGPVQISQVALKRLSFLFTRNWIFHTTSTANVNLYKFPAKLHKFQAIQNMVTLLLAQVMLANGFHQDLLEGLSDWLLIFGGCHHCFAHCSK